MTATPALAPSAHAAAPASPAVVPGPAAPDASAASAAHSFAPIRPDRMTVWPMDEGSCGIDVRWVGRECILRAVVVRRLLTEAGYPTTSHNSVDGRNWELSVGPVPTSEVANVIETYIW